MATTGNCRYHPERPVEAVCRVCGAELCGECAKGGYCICPKHSKPTTAWRVLALLALLSLLPLGYWIANVNRPAALSGAQDFTDQIAKGVLDRVKTACGEFAKDVGRYPTTGEGLEALVKGKRATDSPEVVPAPIATPQPPSSNSGEAKPVTETKASDIIPSWRGPYLPLEMWDNGFPDGLGGKVQYEAAKSLFSHDSRFRVTLEQPPPRREARPEGTKSTNG